MIESDSLKADTLDAMMKMDTEFSSAVFQAEACAVFVLEKGVLGKEVLRASNSSADFTNDRVSCEEAVEPVALPDCVATNGDAIGG